MTHTRKHTRLPRLPSLTCPEALQLLQPSPNLSGRPHGPATSASKKSRKTRKATEPKTTREKFGEVEDEDPWLNLKEDKIENKHLYTNRAKARNV